MGIIKFVTKFGKGVRGGDTPAQIFIGCFLGIFVGMIPGLNLFSVVGLFLLFFLNFNKGFGVLGIAIGKILCLALAPVTFNIGFFIVHEMGMESFFRSLAVTPFTALMDFQIYCLVGGLPFAIVIGILYAWRMTKLIIWLRDGIRGTGERSERMKRLAANKIVRGLLWLAFGPEKKPSDEEAAKKKKVKPIRTKAIVVCVLVVVLVALAQWAVSGSFLGDSIKEHVGKAVGAEVNVASANLSLLAGRMEIDGLQVTDPENPTHNMISADKLVGDLGFMGFAAKRLVVDELTISGLGFNQLRKSPGEVYKDVKKDPEKKEKTLSQYFENREQVEKYLNNLKKLKEYLDKISAVKERLSRPASAEEKKSLKDELLGQNERYIVLFAKRILEGKASFLIRNLNIDKITVGEGSKIYSIIGEGLSDHPESLPTPMKITVADNAGLLISTVFNFVADGPGHHVKIKVPNVVVGDAVKLTSKVPINIEQANADIEADGYFSEKGINLPVTIRLTNLNAKGRGKGVLGLDSGSTSEMFSSIKELTITLRLTGDINNPSVEIDSEKILADLKKELVKAGKAALADRVNKELEKFGGDILKDGKLGIPKGLPKVDSLFKLPTTPGKTPKETDKKKVPASKPADLLKKLGF